MKKTWITIFLMTFASLLLHSEAFGVKLVEIFDYGKAFAENLSRTVIWGSEETLLVTSDYSIGMDIARGGPRLLIFDLSTRKTTVPSLPQKIGSLDVMRMRDGKHFQLYTNTQPDGHGLKKISVVSLEDGSMRTLDAEEVKLNRQETIPWAKWKWRSESAKPESLQGMLRETDSLSAYEDWDVWNNGIIVTAGPGNGFDSAYLGFSAFDMQGRWLFRFPNVVAPVVDDQSMNGKTVEVSPDERYLLINGNAYLKDIIPGELDQRREVGFVYRLMNEAEWQSERDFNASYVRFAEDLSKVELDLPIDGRRFSVAPGDVPLWGMYGRLTSDRVNLRQRPSVSSPVLTLMMQKVETIEFKFVIRERTAAKSRVGNVEDYWYRVTYEIPRGLSPDKMDHSWTGWVFGAYIEILPSEKQYGS